MRGCFSPVSTNTPARAQLSFNVGESQLRKLTARIFKDFLFADDAQRSAKQLVKPSWRARLAIGADIDRNWQ